MEKSTNNRIKEVSLYTALFIVGAVGYATIEILFRGFTHWSMALTGGACFLTFYFIEKSIPNASIFVKAFWGAVVITTYEFFVGCIVNIWFDLNVWDYSNRAFSLYGQICPLFSLIWFLLCLCLAGTSRFLYNGRKRKQTNAN